MCATFLFFFCPFNIFFVFDVIWIGQLGCIFKPEGNFLYFLSLNRYFILLESSLFDNFHTLSHFVFFRQSLPTKRLKLRISILLLCSIYLLDFWLLGKTN